MRCVIGYFYQRNGVDFGATYTPTSMMASLRILLTAVVANGRISTNGALKNEYCHGVKDRETYITFPDRIHHHDERNK
jgi:hypothetical protein